MSIRRQNSEKYFSEAKSVMVGGVNSPVRSFKSVGGQPIVMKYGRQATLYDYDHNAFTDYCLSWGALILGHAHPNVVLSAKKTIEKGASFGTTTREEIELARLIVDRVPSIDLVRFVNSGTEATMSAIRLARGFTGRDVIIKFDGCYHGHADALLTKAGSGVAQLKESSSLGIPKASIENTISLPYNNVTVLEQTIKNHGARIACIILEPVAGNMGVIPPTPEFLKKLREFTQKNGIVLIFDEVMTGFRTHTGCFQSECGITPDMTCLGKIIGGGFPIGAYGGRKDIMRHLAPEGGVYQAGTFAGNPAVMKAGAMTLRLLNQKVYDQLNARSEALAERFNAWFKKQGADAHISYYKSMMSIRFRREPVKNYDDALAAAGGEWYAQLFRHLLERKIYWPPADLEAFFISCMHKPGDLDMLFESVTSFFQKK